MAEAVLKLRGQDERKTIFLDLCFQIIQSEQITLSTDITDHIVEDHTSVQDHITIKPRTYTMRGLISEKFYVHPDLAYSEIPPEPLSVKLTPLKIIAPRVNSTVQSAINAYEAIKNKVVQIYNIGKNILSLGRYFSQRSTASIFPYTVQYDQRHEKWSKDKLQLKVIEVLDGFRVNRLPVSVSTGWGGNLGENYYITDISVNQGDTYQQSELSVTVKELRFTDIKTVALTQEKLSRYQEMNKDFTDTVTGQSEDNRTVWAREVDRAKN